ncbi:MAG: sigma-70 family RNA polymerase sigma factor [Candidatus Hydrogenedentes bacterium]|nr:sigma-70 family RNA polymerase sigma factor [Candidatus Hydrogenedentota bacterium]
MRRPELFAVWAFRIISHKCRDILRRKQRRARLHDAYEVEVSRRKSASREGSAQDLLAHASPEDRALLALRYVEGFTLTEIGNIMNMPAGTVKSRLYHGRKRLRAILEDTDNE